MKDEIELLAPAGSFDSLKAAISAGADAVYAGGALFGARAYAENFDEESLKRAIDFTHIHNKKIYLTLNTLLKEDEISTQLGEFLIPLYREGLDAVIVQDLGVLSFVHENFPSLRIHASTQMGITTAAGVEALRRMGVQRVILPRELSLEEIRQISSQTESELEIFVHGAMCYSYSGQCLMSGMIGGRSGNRGRCAGPCRLPYDLRENMDRRDCAGERYLLNMKDLCTIRQMPLYLDAGVSSLKIEGRMKSPEYVAGTVEIYRKYLDRCLESGVWQKGAEYTGAEPGKWRVDASDLQKLTDLYSRGSFTDGYLNRLNGRSMLALDGPAERIRETAYSSELRRNYLETEKKEKVYGIVKILKHKEALFQLKYGTAEARVCGPVPEEAHSRPLTKETVRDKFSRMGNTDFVLENLEILLDDNLYLDIKTMNEMRRACVEKLTDQILARSRRSDPAVKYESRPEEKAEYTNPVYTALVSDLAQLEPVFASDKISEIYVESFLLDEDRISELAARAKKEGKQLFLATPHVFRERSSLLSERERSRKLDFLRRTENIGYLVRNLDACEYLLRYAPKPIVFDYTCWRMNSRAQAVWEQLGRNFSLRTCVSPELNEKELLHSKVAGCEFLIYGKIPVMVTANCLRKTASGCNGTPGDDDPGGNHVSDLSLIDRKNTEFDVKTVCRYCYNLIYNSVPISLGVEEDRLSRFGFGAYRYQFTTESAKETEEILSGKPVEKRTRGHFYRGVE